jgi:hypothetical protein
MTWSHDSEPETIDAIDAACIAAASELEGSEDGVLVTGYILAAAYVNGAGEHLWTIRFRPDQPFMTTAGLEKVVSRYVNRVADELVDQDDEE